MLQETKAEHGDIQVLFTIAEEGGVNGSRCMDKSLLHADVGYALDSEGPSGRNRYGCSWTGQGTF